MSSIPKIGSSAKLFSPLGAILTIVLTPELVTSDRFSKAMYGTYQLMVGESMFYRHQVYKQLVNEVEITTQELKEA
jgi:hypothetical protein